MAVFASLYLKDFYIQAERRQTPELIGRSLLICNRHRVLAVSQEARSLGAYPGQAVRPARRLCQGGTFLDYHPERYAALAREALDVAALHTLRIEPLYPHEAFFDLTACPDPARAWADIVDRLEEKGFVPLLGVASCKTVARTAALYLNRLHRSNVGSVLRPSDEKSFLDPLPVGLLWSVDATLRQRLHRLGLYRIGEVAAVPTEELVRQLGPMGEQVSQFSRGKDRRRIEAHYPPLTLVTDFTPETEIDDLEAFRQALGVLSGRIASELQKRSESCYQLRLSLHLGGTMIESSATLRGGIKSETDLFRSVCRLAEKMSLPGPILALRLQAEDLRLMKAVQTDLFGLHERKRQLAGLWETVKRRFGEDAMKSASTLYVPRRVRAYEALLTSYGVNTI